MKLNTETLKNIFCLVRICDHKRSQNFLPVSDNNDNVLDSYVTHLNQRKLKSQIPGDVFCLVKISYQNHSQILPPVGDKFVTHLD